MIKEFGTSSPKSDEKLSPVFESVLNSNDPPLLTFMEDNALKAEVKSF